MGDRHVIDCLAATGFAPQFPAIAAVLLVLIGGGVIAVIAHRRKASGVALVIALLILAVPLSLAGGAPSASAAGQCSEAGAPAPAPVIPVSASPSPECVPAAPAEDVIVAPASAWNFDNDPTTLDWFSGSTADSYFGAVQAIGDIDPSPVVTASLYPSAQNDPTFIPTGAEVDVTGDYSVSGSGVSVDRSDFLSTQPDRANAGGTALAQKFVYSDGCGGTLTSTITVGASWAYAP